MATYAEIHALYDNDALRQRIEVALLVAAQAMIDGANPTAAQRAWSRMVFERPQGEADKVLKYLLAKNRALTVAQITSSTDSALQTAVDAVAAQLVAAATGA